MTDDSGRAWADVLRTNTVLQSLDLNCAPPSSPPLARRGGGSAGGADDNGACRGAVNPGITESSAVAMLHALVASPKSKLIHLWLEGAPPCDGCPPDLSGMFQTMVFAFFRENMSFANQF